MVFSLIAYLYAVRICWCRTVDRRLQWLIGAIGVPAHELGHAFMCVLFGHRVTAINLFSPEGPSGVLGYVSHSWNTRSPYQRIGCFFIGIAPLPINTALAWWVMQFLPKEVGTWPLRLQAVGLCFVASSLLLHAAPSSRDMVGASHGAFMLVATAILVWLLFPSQADAMVNGMLSLASETFVWVLGMTLPFLLIAGLLGMIKFTLRHRRGRIDAGGNFR